ncbi:MAG: hypothetical protein ACKOCN_11775 [Planctomycetaceae bacterium]
MSDILFHYYRVNPTTWFYLASLLSIALFFKFNRLWSFRNLDLSLLVLMAPGLLAVRYGELKAATETEQAGFIWIFAVSGLLMLRMLSDSSMVRRPLLEPNLTTGGLVFLGLSLLVYQTANVINTPPEADAVAGAAAAEKLQAREPAVDADQLTRLGPGYPLLFLLPKISTQRFFAPDADSNPIPRDQTDGEAPRDRDRRAEHEATARIMAILSHLAIVAGTVTVGWLHFENIKLGIAAAVLYLLLPCTSMMTGRVDHLLPGALVTWAIAGYRRPLLAGSLIGLAIGTIYYPVFLLPLWCSFYWEKGIGRFATGVATTLAALVAGLWMTSPDMAIFVDQLRQMFGWILPNAVTCVGFWQWYDPVFRLPVLAAFVAMMASLAIWPAHKHLGTLMSCTAAVLLGCQFWKAHEGGLFMAWYLPVLLLVVFRPNLENRIALAMPGSNWFSRRGSGPFADQAA